MGSTENQTAETSTLRQIAPGVYVDERVVQLDRERRWLLLDDAGLAEIGLTRKQYWTLTRLAEAGMIKLYRVSPRVALMDLGTWWKHMEAVGEDPWFWEDRKRIQAYRGTYN